MVKHHLKINFYIFFFKRKLKSPTIEFRVLEQIKRQHTTSFGRGHTLAGEKISAQDDRG